MINIERICDLSESMGDFGCTNSYKPSDANFGLKGFHSTFSNNEELSSLLFEALNGFFFILNEDGVIEYVSENVKNYIFFAQDEMIGKSIKEFVSNQDYEEFFKSLRFIGSPSGSNGSTSRNFCCRMRCNQDNSLQPMLISFVSHSLPKSQNSDETKLCLACIARAFQLDGNDSFVLGLNQFSTVIRSNDYIIENIDCSCLNSQMFTLTNLTGQCFMDLVHSSDHELVRQHYQSALNKESVTSPVYRLRISNKQYAFVQTRSKLRSNSLNSIASTHTCIRFIDDDNQLSGTVSSGLMKFLFGEPNTSVSSPSIAVNRVPTSIGFESSSNEMPTKPHRNSPSGRSRPLRLLHLLTTSNSSSSVMLPGFQTTSSDENCQTRGCVSMPLKQEELVQKNASQMTDPVFTKCSPKMIFDNSERALKGLCCENGDNQSQCISPNDDSPSAFLAPEKGYYDTNRKRFNDPFLSNGSKYRKVAENVKQPLSCHLSNSLPQRNLENPQPPLYSFDGVCDKNTSPTVEEAEDQSVAYNSHSDTQPECTNNDDMLENVFQFVLDICKSSNFNCNETVTDIEQKLAQTVQQCSNYSQGKTDVKNDCILRPKCEESGILTGYLVSGDLHEALDCGDVPNVSITSYDPIVSNSVPKCQTAAVNSPYYWKQGDVPHLISNPLLNQMCSKSTLRNSYGMIPNAGKQFLRNNYRPCLNSLQCPPMNSLPPGASQFSYVPTLSQDFLPMNVNLSVNIQNSNTLNIHTASSNLYPHVQHTSNSVISETPNRFNMDFVMNSNEDIGNDSFLDCHLKECHNDQKRTYI